MTAPLALSARAPAAITPAGGTAGERARISIVGGTLAPGGSWPWAVYVQAITDPGPPLHGFACTGTVVAPNVVLTAGHCATDEATGAVVPAADYTVVAGAHDLSVASAGQQLAVKQVIRHPSYALNAGGAPIDDVALLILATSTSSPAIALAGSADAALTAPGTVAAMAGWGLTDGSASTPPAQLSQAAANVESDATCRASWRRLYDPATMLCTHDDAAGATSTCSGDSGGPLAVQRADGTWVEIGVTSWGDAACSPTSPSVFARVSAVSGWIEQQIAAAAGGPAPSPSPSPGPSPPPPTAPSATAPTPPPVVTPSPAGSDPSAPGVTPRRPVAVTPPAPRIRAGRYRGTTRQRRALALRVAAGGRAVSGVRLSAALRCTRRSRRPVASLVGIGGTRGWKIAASRGLDRFSVRVTRGGVTYAITGSFTAPDRVVGTLRATSRTPTAGRCDSGAVRFTVMLT